MMQEVLVSRDPQVIRHLLIYAAENPSEPHIAKDALFNNLMNSVKQFY